MLQLTDSIDNIHIWRECQRSLRDELAEQLFAHGEYLGYACVGRQYNRFAFVRRRFTFETRRERPQLFSSLRICFAWHLFPLSLAPNGRAAGASECLFTRFANPV
jgi:hypothetical protein